MDVRKLESQLQAEGFSHTFVWQDGPNAYYPDHTHNGITAHIILDGEMTLTVRGESQTYRAGDRCDVGAWRSPFCEDGAERMPLFDWRDVGGGGKRSVQCGLTRWVVYA